MRDMKITKPKGMNDPQHTMATHGASGVKVPHAGFDLGRNATNVIRKLGTNPEPAGPTARALNK